LRSAGDSGLEVPPEVIKLAIKDVREHYSSRGGQQGNETEQQRDAGQFTYSKGGGGPSPAMAAAGVVCLQEFGQYDDWRIAKNMELSRSVVKQQLKPNPNLDGQPGLDAYTLYYIDQAMYQVGAPQWKEYYPLLRDHLVACE